MYAYTSILAALIAARQHRAGLPHRRVDAREHGRVDELPAVLRLSTARAPPPRAGAAHATIYPVRPVPRRRRQDGDAGPAERARMGGCSASKVLQQPELAADPRFASNARAHGSARRAARDHRRRLFATLTRRAGRSQRLDAAQIANARMNDMHDVWAHPQLKARERWVDVGTPAGDDPRAAAAGRARRVCAAHGPGAGAGPAHRRHPAPSSATAATPSPRCAARRHAI